MERTGDKAREADAQRKVKMMKQRSHNSREARFNVRPFQVIEAGGRCLGEHETEIAKLSPRGI